MTVLDDDESLAYEIIKALEYQDYITPISGIPKVVELLKKYRKPTLREQVLAFHKRFGQSIGEKPHVPDEKTVRFRLSLIAEEFFELLEATHPTLVNGRIFREARGAITWMIKEAAIGKLVDDIPTINLPDFVDAMADLDYVVEGTRITFGVDGAPIAAEVQRANMAKLPSYVAAKDAHHRGDVGMGSDDGCLKDPIKREDGKILKPPGWTPPDIEGELKKQGWEP